MGGDGEVQAHALAPEREEYRVGDVPLLAHGGEGRRPLGGGRVAAGEVRGVEQPAGPGQDGGPVADAGEEGQQVGGAPGERGCQSAAVTAVLRARVTSVRNRASAGVWNSGCKGWRVAGSSSVPVDRRIR